MSRGSYAVRTVAQDLPFFLLAEPLPTQIGRNLWPDFLFQESAQPRDTVRGARRGEPLSPLLQRLPDRLCLALAGQFSKLRRKPLGFRVDRQCHGIMVPIAEGEVNDSLVGLEGFPAPRRGMRRPPLASWRGSTAPN